MGATEIGRSTGANAEAIEAWDGPLFERFVKFREIVTTGVGVHGEEALRLFPPGSGERVLDSGCGFLRFAGDRAAHLHDDVRDALREGLAEFQTPGGICAPASKWIVSAVA